MARRPALVLLFSGFALYAIFVATGVVKFGIFLIFPFFISSSPLSLIPFLLFLSGIIALAVPVNDEYDGETKDLEVSQEKRGASEGKREFAGLIMIGPIPIIFGNNRKMLYILIGVAVFVLLVILLYYVR